MLTLNDIALKMSNTTDEPGPGNSEGSNMVLVNGQAKKIPRPRNAFLIFAKENRPRLSKMHGELGNQEISVKLGDEWRNLKYEEKEKYHQMAAEEAKSHKRKYPFYQYRPKRKDEGKKSAKNILSRSSPVWNTQMCGAGMLQPRPPIAFNPSYGPVFQPYTQFGYGGPIAPQQNINPGFGMPFYGHPQQQLMFNHDYRPLSNSSSVMPYSGVTTAGDQKTMGVSGIKPSTIVPSTTTRSSIENTSGTKDTSANTQSNHQDTTLSKPQGTNSARPLVDPNNSRQPTETTHGIGNEIKSEATSRPNGHPLQEPQVGTSDNETPKSTSKANFNSNKRKLKISSGSLAKAAASITVNPVKEKRSQRQKVRASKPATSSNAINATSNIITSTKEKPTSDNTMTSGYISKSQTISPTNTSESMNSKKKAKLTVSTNPDGDEKSTNLKSIPCTQNVTIEIGDEKTNGNDEVNGSQSMSKPNTFKATLKKGRQAIWDSVATICKNPYIPGQNCQWNTNAFGVMGGFPNSCNPGDMGSQQPLDMNQFYGTVPSFQSNAVPPFGPNFVSPQQTQNFIQWPNPESQIAYNGMCPSWQSAPPYLGQMMNPAFFWNGNQCQPNISSHSGGDSNRSQGCPNTGNCIGNALLTLLQSSALPCSKCTGKNCKET